jgi:Zeta toxin
MMVDHQPGAQATTGGPTVVAVAGPPGSGKTALVRAVASRLPDAVVIAYDDYETLTRQSPEAISAWLDEGGDPNRVDLTDLVSELGQLVAGQSIRDRGSGEPVRARGYVIFDTPFGRAHRQSGRYIDLLIWLDLPAEIALVRKLRQFTAACLEDAEPAEAHRFVKWLDGYLANYLAIVRRACDMQRERVVPDADLCFDGCSGLEALTDQVLNEIARRGLSGQAAAIAPAAGRPEPAPKN